VSSSSQRLTLARYGRPLQFGETVKFVCEKGMAFEKDFHLESVEFTCQASSRSFTSCQTTIGGDSSTLNIQLI
jgi:hypothetical protein